MRRMFGVGALVLALTGCSDATNPTDTTYTVAFDRDPAVPGLLLAQDGDGAWQPVALDAGGRGTFTVTRGFHGWVGACVYPSFVFVRELHDAGAGGDPVLVCGRSTGGVQISGAVNPADADVWLNDNISVHGAGSYDDVVPPGTYDVMATTPTRMLIERGVAVDTNATLDLDVDARGFDLLVPVLTVTGAGTPSVYSELHTLNHGYAWLAGARTVVPLVPAAQRRPGDRVVIGASATEGDVTRLVQRLVSGDTPPTLVLGDGPVVTATRAGLQWTDGWDEYVVSGQQIAGGQSSVQVTVAASQAWSDATGATVLPWPDLAALPGWDPAWPALLAGNMVRWTAAGTTGVADGDLDQRTVTGTLTW